MKTWVSSLVILLGFFFSAPSHAKQKKICIKAIVSHSIKCKQKKVKHCVKFKSPVPGCAAHVNFCTAVGFVCKEKKSLGGQEYCVRGGLGCLSTLRLCSMYGPAFCLQEATHTHPNERKCKLKTKKKKICHKQ